MNNEYRITRDKFLSPIEARQLLKTCQEKALVDLAYGRSTWITRYMLVHIAFNTGLRVSEIADLQIGDLFLKGISDMYLIVRHGKGRGENGKKRDVYLDRDIIKHIREYIEFKKKVFDESIAPEAQFFASHSGRKFTTTGLYLSFKKALKAANIPDHYSIHSARHTYATILLAKTNNLRFVQKQLGHTSINMTALYADVLPELNQNLANSILK
ncbi:MAG: tyrosine-type recombinase/integrase [Deltaproteobacteria bacterium]|nr:tyrosine-type recombinase/integrase [Deltaproteobacteria bacterium]